MIVYGLVDPRSREIRYVGETIRAPEKRLSQHLTTARKQTTPPVNAWIRGVLGSGDTPEMVELDVCESVGEMHAAEVYWIEQFQSMGASLLNIAPGGSTRVGYRHTAETRDRWRRERRGKNAPMYGKRRTPEQKARFSEIGKALISKNGHPMKGRHHSAETRAKISDSRRGITPNISPEGMESKRNFCRQRWDSDPAYREKMIRPGLSNPHAKTVVVSGTAYAYAELARHLGINRNTVAKRVKELADLDRELVESDFASRRGKRKAA